MSDNFQYEVPKKPWYRRPLGIVGIVVGVFILFVIVGQIGGGGDGTDTASDTSTSSDTNSAEPEASPSDEKSAKPSKSAKPKPEMTVSQENAIQSAESYLDFAAFSKKGLIKQLSSDYGDGFPKKDAVFAVNHIKVDWNAEAFESAKSYLELSSFSRQGLIEQLTSSYGEQFTMKQAVYAVNKAGL